MNFLGLFPYLTGTVVGGTGEAGAVSIRDACALWHLPREFEFTFACTDAYGLDGVDSTSAGPAMVLQRVGFFGGQATEVDLIRPGVQALPGGAVWETLYRGTYEEEWNTAGGVIDGYAELRVSVPTVYVSAAGVPRTADVLFELFAEFVVTSSVEGGVENVITVSSSPVVGSFAGSFDEGDSTITFNPPGNPDGADGDRERVQDMLLRWATSDVGLDDPTALELRIRESLWFTHGGQWTGAPGQRAPF